MEPYRLPSRHVPRAVDGEPSSDWAMSRHPDRLRSSGPIEVKGHGVKDAVPASLFILARSNHTIDLS